MQTLVVLLIILAVAPVAIGALVMFASVRRAPVAFEDDRGFHVVSTSHEPAVDSAPDSAAFEA